MTILHMSRSQHRKPLAATSPCDENKPSRSIEMIFAPHRPDPKVINQVEAEIRRLEDAQQMMLDANAAVISGDEKTLECMGFESDHIADLLKRKDFGMSAFPNYSIRNNEEAIHHLKGLLGKAKRGIAI